MIGAGSGGAAGVGGSAGSGGSAGTGGSDVTDAAPGRAAFHVIDLTPGHSRVSPASYARASHIHAVSRDGSVVIGESVLYGKVDGASVQAEEPFRWTEAAGTVGLGFLPECDRIDASLSRGFFSRANPDATVIVGDCLSTTGSPLYRWTQASGMTRVDAPPNLPDANWVVVSADGTVALGDASPSGTDNVHVPQPFRWTQATGAVPLGVLGEKGSLLYYATSDAAIAFGVTTGTTGSDIFRWTAATGMAVIQRLAGYDRCLPGGRSMSTDGTAFIGTCTNASSEQLFRWTEATGMKAIVPPGGTTDFGGHELTADGGTILGTLSVATSIQAFRWTERTGIVPLGILPGYDRCSTVNTSEAHASADGTVVIGACTRLWDSGEPERMAFRWTETTGMIALGFLASSDGSMAENITADGSVVAGESLVSSRDPAHEDEIAVYWDAGGHVTSIAAALEGAGIDLQGFKLRYAFVSPSDGHLFWGIGTTAQGERRDWIARVP